MKKAYLPPLAVLAVILAFAVWNSLSMSEDTNRWRDQLQCADAQAQAEEGSEGGEESAADSGEEVEQQNDGDSNIKQVDASRHD